MKKRAKKKKVEKKIEKAKEVREVKEVKEENYREDVIKTLSPLSLGIVAGAVSYLISLEGYRDPLGIIVLVIFIYLHKFILPAFRIEPVGKDWALLSFLTFTAWYISWTFLLNI